MRNYTQADREKIFELHVKHKMNYSQIAKRFGVTKKRNRRSYVSFCKE